MQKRFFLRYYFLIFSILLFSSPVIASDFQPIDLSTYFNNDGISWDTNRNDGDFDGIGDYSPGTFNYAGEELPESNSTITTFGIPFLFADKTDGMKNNILCQGQTISVTTGNYTGVYILGSSVNGSYEEPIIFYYSDQSMETVNLALSDWCGKP